MTPAERTNQIIAEVAAKHGLTLAEIHQDTRVHRIARPRQEAFYELLRRTALSTVQIGRKFNVDHTTVIDGAENHADRNGLPRIRAKDRPRLRAEAEKAAA